MEEEDNDRSFLRFDTPRAQYTPSRLKVWLKDRRNVVLGGVTVLAIVLFIVVVILLAKPLLSHTKNVSSPFPEEDEIKKCLKDHTYSPKGMDTSEKKITQEKDIAIVNAVIWVGDGTVSDASIVTVSKGKIKEVTSIGLDVSKYDVFDAEYKILTPGLIDVHSHSGVYSYPDDAHATSDGNEMTNPTFPQVRAIDAFDPEDPAIPYIRSGGITTIQVLPGSGNVMGGEAAHFKLLGSTVEEMRIPDAPRALKMACGENPKRVYGRRGSTPMSRMGSAWLMREKFYEASKLRDSQDDWCSKSEEDRSGEFPENLALNPLVALLRGEARVNIHCYQVHDIEMIVRLSKEFGFSVTAFHHALEAYKIPQVIFENNITVATFADLWGYKMEGYDASVNAPHILQESGVQTVIKSDHPVTNSQFLMEQAGIATHYGADPQKAIASVTSNAAKVIGLEDRLGLIKADYDADLVLWDRNPLQLGAKATQVWISGVLTVNTPAPPSTEEQSLPPKPFAPIACVDNKDEAKMANYAVTDATIYSMTGGQQPIYGKTIVVTDGHISCVGSCTIPSNYPTFSLQEGIVTPGLIESGSPVGQVEVGAEANTKDGSVNPDYWSWNDKIEDMSHIHAKHGIRLFGRHVKYTRYGGVLVAVVPPYGSSLVTGQSVAFYTLSEGVVLSDVTISTNISLNMNIGNDAKEDGSITSSVSGQFSILRRKLADAEQSTNPIWSNIKQGNTKLVIKTNSADIMDAVIDLKKIEFPKLDIVFLGAAEALVIADKLLENDIGVVVTRCTPEKTFTEARCHPDQAATLLSKGVKVAVAAMDEDNARNLRWYAGLMREYGLDFTDALSLVTSQVAKVFGLSAVGSISVGQKANFVGWDADPLSFNGHVTLIAVGDNVECNPRPY